MIKVISLKVEQFFLCALFISVYISNLLKRIVFNLKPCTICCYCFYSFQLFTIKTSLKDLNKFCFNKYFQIWNLFCLVFRLSFFLILFNEFLFLSVEFIHSISWIVIRFYNKFYSALLFWLFLFWVCVCVYYKFSNLN